MRLIDADEAKKYIKERWSDYFCHEYFADAVIQFLDEQPTACSNNAIQLAYHEGCTAGLDVVNHIISGFTYTDRTDYSAKPLSYTDRTDYSAKPLSYTDRTDYPLKPEVKSCELKDKNEDV